MTLITDLRTEHGEIHELFYNIEKEMNVLENNIEKARSISARLIEIKDRIINHMKIEEEKLYPILLDKERPDGIVDKEIISNQVLVEDFLKEQKEIGLRFVDYIEKYSKPDNIIKYYQDFLFETGQIFRTMQSRIEAEEKKLFPLFHADSFIF